MSGKIEWREEFNIGVDVIDREHQRLFKIINKLFTFQEEEKDNRWMCEEGIKFFKGHAMKHFADEEAYMASVGFEGMEQHKRIHAGFREHTLPSLEQELERTNYAPDAVDHFLAVCTGWLIGHTLAEDQAITGKRPRRWENMLPSEEARNLKRLIVQLVFDMFQLEAQMISEAYGGEKFGKGIYYRLVYGTDREEARQEIFWVFEEKLLVNTVGKILGLKTSKVDTMLLHASRYTARQMVERILEHLPAAEGYELKEENLLSYEQFREILDRGKLQISLMFNTGGSGYFACCVMAPHLLQSGVATPIEHKNAIAEVEKYLLEREQQQVQEETHPKPKILMVDDSASVRLNMKQLLEADYEVLLAESGVGAIRAITLNRPDVILLDYEMPVCNGKQTLEMLRSEREFADIPVIFLTGRGDPDLVRELLSLKPAGYLLKYLKPAEIKQKIDAYFARQKA